MLHCFDPIRTLSFWAILVRLTPLRKSLIIQGSRNSSVSDRKIVD